MATLTKKIARKVLEVVDAGLCSGLGRPEPGFMCVEAAVCYALGQPHGDEPECVSAAVHSFKVRLNDSKWSSNEARAKGMRRVAIAQLGSAGVVDDHKFRMFLAEQIIRQIVPIAMRAAAKRNPKRAEELEAAAVRCENEGTREALEAARATARAVYSSAAAYAAAYAAAAAAAYAADAYAYAADAYAAAADAYAAAAYAAAADAYAAAAYAADAAERDRILTLCAEIGVQALEHCGSPGCKWLDICDE